MDEDKELPTVFQGDVQVGDEMIIMGSHVRINKIELVIHTKIMDDTRPTRKGITVKIPMDNSQNPFPYQKK
jgi:hypothetical protein